MVLVPTWKRTTIGQPAQDDLNADAYKQSQAAVAERYTAVLKAGRAAGRPMFPPATPAVVGGAVVYLTDRSVAAASLLDLVLEGEQIRRGKLLWESLTDFGLVPLEHDPEVRAMAGDWFKRQSPAGLADFFSHRTLAKSLAVRAGRVFVVDELGILPPDDIVRAGYGFGPLDRAYRRNTVRVVDLDTGKLVARLPEGMTGRDGPARIFLGAPLVEGDRCYFVYERDRALRARCLSFKDYVDARRPGAERGDADGKVWDTELDRILDRLPDPATRDVHRRAQALFPVRAGENVIFPTNLGIVVALNAASGKPAWSVPYARTLARGHLTATPEWVAVPPAVAGDKYVYAPADLSELLCLNVAGGKKVWSVKKGDGLYPAVVGDRVLVIGEKSIRSLALKDGSEQWKADLPGLPCGRGAQLGDAYLVPVSEPKTWKGLIAVVDLKAGKVAELLRPEKDEPIGNLVVHQDFLISQTLTEIAVFPIKKKE